MRGCAPQGKKMLASFVQFCKFQLGKKYAFFLPIGGKICIFPPFQISFNHFYPPTCYLAIFFCLLPQHVTWPYFSVCPPPHPRSNRKYTPLAKTRPTTKTLKAITKRKTRQLQIQMYRIKEDFVNFSWYNMVVYMTSSKCDKKNQCFGSGSRNRGTRSG